MDKRVIALASALLVVLVAAPASAAPDPPASMRWSSYSAYGTAGLNATASLTLRAFQDLTQVSVRFAVEPEGSGVTLPPATSYMYNTGCSQSDGPGGDIVCGPFDLAAGSGRAVSANLLLPSGFLLDHAGAPLAITARLTGTQEEIAEVPPLLLSRPVYSSLFHQTIIYRTPREVTSPGATELRLRITNGGNSQVANVIGRWVVPPQFQILSLPGGCEVSGEDDAGQHLTCVIDRFLPAYYADFPVAVRVKPGLDVGPITIPDPQWTITSAYEPPGRPSSWSAAIVGSPYIVTVVGEGPPLVVDLGLDLTQPPGGPFAPGTKIEVPFRYSCDSASEAATEVKVTFELRGPVGRIEAPAGCTLTGMRLICTRALLRAGESIAGLVSIWQDGSDSGEPIDIEATLTAAEPTAGDEPSAGVRLRFSGAASSSDLPRRGSPPASRAGDPTPSAAAKDNNAGRQETTVAGATRPGTLSATGTAIAGPLTLSAALLAAGALALAVRGRRTGMGATARHRRSM